MVFLAQLLLDATCIKSRWCDKHKIVACDTKSFDPLHNDDTKDLDAPVGPVIWSSRRNQHGENIIKAITAKKQTRNSTYYKVNISKQQCIYIHPLHACTHVNALVYM